MSIARPILLTLSTLVVVTTLLPLVRLDHWWIRIFDFPRAQILVLGVVLLGVFGLWMQPRLVVDWIAVVLLAGAIVYQTVRIVPYSPLYRVEVLSTKPGAPGPTLSMLSVNVLQPNRNAGALLEMIEARSPDLVLALETDAWWERQLRVLEARYPHTVLEPLDNTYGMLLYSRFPLHGAEVKYLVEPGIPSIHARVQLPDGRQVQLYCVHPEPPHPAEADSTTERDAELLLVGRAAKKQTLPTVVMGDLNDVAWSYTTRLFQRISGLLDPRVGRGMFNTFHARYPFLRYPLDHVFHSEHFKLVHLERLPYFGSDHFPILIRLQMEPGAAQEQATPEADAEDRRMAREKIQKGNPQEAP